MHPFVHGGNLSSSCPLWFQFTKPVSKCLCFLFSSTGRSETTSSSSSSSQLVPPLSSNELPLPYTPTPQGGIPMINCKVCQAMINIEGKLHQHVVKCSVCHEATVSTNSHFSSSCHHLCFPSCSDTFIIFIELHCFLWTVPVLCTWLSG